MDTEAAALAAQQVEAAAVQDDDSSEASAQTEDEEDEEDEEPTVNGCIILRIARRLLARPFSLSLLCCVGFSQPPWWRFGLVSCVFSAACEAVFLLGHCSLVHHCGVLVAGTGTRTGRGGRA